MCICRSAWPRRTGLRGFQGKHPLLSLPSVTFCNPGSSQQSSRAFRSRWCHMLRAKGDRAALLLHSTDCAELGAWK